MIWQPEFTDKTLSRKPGAVQSQQNGEKAKTVLTGSKFTIAKACSGKAGDEMVSRANIRMVKANKTTSKNAANIT